MENKYFTPNIRDLRIGYEYEQFYEFLEPQWRSQTIHNHIEMEIDLDPNTVRTPYLTKEQIYKEGWEETLSRNVFMKGHCNLGYLPNEIDCPQIWITWETSVKYAGSCKSINELRFLLELLNMEYA